MRSSHRLYFQVSVNKIPRKLQEDATQVTTRSGHCLFAVCSLGSSTATPGLLLRDVRDNTPISNLHTRTQQRAYVIGATAAPSSGPQNEGIIAAQGGELWDPATPNHLPILHCGRQIKTSYFRVIRDRGLCVGTADTWLSPLTEPSATCRNCIGARLRQLHHGERARNLSGTARMSLLISRLRRTRAALPRSAAPFRADRPISWQIPGTSTLPEEGVTEHHAKVTK